MVADTFAIASGADSVGSKSLARVSSFPEKNSRSIVIFIEIKSFSWSSSERPNDLVAEERLFSVRSGMLSVWIMKGFFGADDPA